MRARACALLVVLATVVASRADVRADDVAAPGQANAEPSTGLPALEAAFRAAPGEVGPGLAYADALLAAGERDVALKCFRKNLAERPADRVAAFLLGRVEGKEEGARAMWEALLERLGLPDGREAALAEAWDALATVEQQLGRDERMAQALERRLALAPTAYAWLRLGWVRERLGQLGPAEEAYRKSHALDGQAVATRNALALVLARQKKHGEAQRLARETVKQAPDSAEAHVHLGLVLGLGGDARGAAAAYQQATERARGNAPALAVIGASLAELEQYDLAQQALAGALALDPGNATVLLDAAAIAVQREQWADAKKLLDRAAKAAPKNARTAYLQGIVALRTQQLDPAIQALRRAVSLDPREPAYALSLAVAYVERGATEQAIQALTEAAPHCPENAEIPLRLGFLQMQRKRWNAALEAFRRAATLAPKDADVHLYLAVLYGDHMELPAQALHHLQEYQRLGGREPSALRWLEELQADK